MKISLNWVADYVTLPSGLSPQEIAYQLTMATVEVEGVHEADGDAILEIDNKSMTNRPDLWGHYGLARELASIFKVPLKPLPDAGPALAPSPLLGDIDPAVCRRFTATRIENVSVLETPEWMKTRLIAIGQRSKNLYADLTNYVMLATGQPTHAFDADRLSLPLSVRCAEPGEVFDALDGTHLTLTSSDAVVADGKSAVALAGIIGGLGSAIQPGTRSVVFEAANFEPLAIRRSSVAHSARTEASTRFEKSLSTHRIDDARRLFFHLLKEIDPGARATAFDERVNATTPHGTIRANAQYLRDRIGKDLSIGELRAPLDRLGFDVAVSGDDLTVTVPEWRNTGDVSGPHDLVEEVARLYGYSNFDFQAPLVALDHTVRNYAQGTERRLKEYLAFSCGMQEVITYPWIDDRYVVGAGLAVDASSLHLATPPAPDQSTLRTSIVPSMLKSIASSIRWRSEFRIFESGRTFPDGERRSVDDTRERLPFQPSRLAAALVGTNAETMFREAKGIIEHLGARAHVAPIRTQPGALVAWADSGACVELWSEGIMVGHLGVLNRRGARAAGLKHGFAVVFELDLDLIKAHPSRDNKYTPLPELPPFDIDVSQIYPDTVPWASITTMVQGVDPLIASIEFVDQYRGTGIPEGYRSITLRAHLQPVSQTLTSDEASAVANAIRATVRERCGALDRA
jgi:phenylalanyl-tRNA synthetase beta chain